MNPIEIRHRENNLSYLKLAYTSESSGKTATLELCMQGAHICSYKPDGETELLWMSTNAYFEKGKAIRGGIPICWPWFGPHWSSPQENPQHGFARVSEFELLSQQADKQGTRVVLGLGYLPELYNAIEMQVEVELSDSLSVQIRATNKGKQPVEIGAALHTYFRISDTDKVDIPKIQGLNYKDKTCDYEQFSQTESIEINQEIDRVYLDPPSNLDLLDTGLNQKIEINTWGNSDLVIWNPWIENAKNMADFDNQGYRSMLCIEPANALDNRILLKPDEEHLLGKKIQLFSI